MSTTEVAAGATTDKRLYLGVRHKTVPDAKGIIVSFTGDDGVIVMRTHDHLGMGTQDWEALWVEDDSAPVYKTDYGEMKLGQRVVFGSPYAGMLGTVVGHDGDGFTYFFVDAGQIGFDTKPEWSNPDNTEKPTMFSPSSCEWHRVGDEVGVDADGEWLHVGDRVVYDRNGDDGASTFVRVVGTILKKMGGTLVTLVLDPQKEDGSPVTGYAADYVGAKAKPCDLTTTMLTRLPEAQIAPKVATGNVSKHGEPIYVGDLLEYVPGNPAWGGVKVRALDSTVEPYKRYEFVEVNDQIAKDGHEVGHTVNLTSSDLVHVTTDEDASDPETLGPAFKYADGVLIRKGDRVVYDPGYTFSGVVATVVGQSNALPSKVTVKRDDSMSGTVWTVGKFSRLQDEDKEKVADEAPHPVAASTKLQELLERIGDLKGDVEEAVSRIESELSAAEDAEPSVTFEGDLSSAISVSTSNDTLLGLIEYDGCGNLTIDDSRVDEHAAESASVDESMIEYTVNTEGLLEDVHSAFAKGQESVGELLEAVEEIHDLLDAVLDDAEVSVKAEATLVPTKDPETFKGKISNARFGVTLPEDADTGPTLRFDVVADHIESTGGDSSGTKATRRVRLIGKQIGTFMSTVGISDVKNLEGREAVVTEDAFGGWYPTAVSQVPDLGPADDYEDEDEYPED